MSGKRVKVSEFSSVVIVGGGVIGTSIAFYLSKGRDLSIALIDLKKSGNASFSSAGGLWPIGESVGLGCGVIFFKTFSQQLAKHAGENLTPERPPQLPDFFFEFCLKSNALFPDLWMTLKEDYGVDFKFEKTGLKFIMYDENDQIYAKQIADSIPHLRSHLRWLDAKELADEEPYITPEAVGALMFLNDDQVNPFRTGILTSAITGKVLHALVHKKSPPVDINPFLLERFDTM